MGNDLGKAHDSMAVGVTAPLADRSFGTTVWQVDRWSQEQTRDAMLRLHDLGLDPPVRMRMDPFGMRSVPDFAITPEQFAELGIRPYETSQVVGNLITNAGWTRLMNLLTNQGATQAFDATHTRIGVGNSNTAEAYTDTDLGAAAGSANRWFQLVSGAGTLGTRTLSFSATFGTADGNFAWNEFGLDQGTASGNTVTAVFFNHKASISQGTKASGQTWTATATLTFS